jgi:hypothetical protein
MPHYWILLDTTGAWWFLQNALACCYCERALSDSVIMSVKRSFCRMWCQGCSILGRLDLRRTFLPGLPQWGGTLRLKKGSAARASTMWGGRRLGQRKALQKARGRSRSTGCNCTAQERNKHSWKHSTNYHLYEFFSFELSRKLQVAALVAFVTKDSGSTSSWDKIKTYLSQGYVYWCTDVQDNSVF